MANCKTDFQVEYDLIFGTPTNPNYMVIGVMQGSDVFINYDFTESFNQYVGLGYHLTMYKKDDGSMMVSVPITDAVGQIIVNDFNFGNAKAIVVIEDRSDINNIDRKTLTSYILFKQFDAAQTTSTVIGQLQYRNRDGSFSPINYYNTGF